MADKEVTILYKIIINKKLSKKIKTGAVKPVFFIGTTIINQRM